MTTFFFKKVAGVVSAWRVERDAQAKSEMGLRLSESSDQSDNGAWQPNLLQAGEMELLHIELAPIGTRTRIYCLT